MNFHLKFLKANLRGGKGETFMVGPGRDSDLLRHWSCANTVSVIRADV